MANSIELGSWLQEQCAEYTFNVGGVFQRESAKAWWPFTADGPTDLQERLTRGGHLLPLPSEPAALANVMEVSIVNFLILRVQAMEGVQASRGTERGYPDLEISGPAFGGGFHAIDVKAARRKTTRRQTSDPQTQSRITLYTGNTYFKWPDLHWAGTFRPFNDYATHIDVIMLYRHNPDNHARVEDLEIVVQEPWRIASRERSSTTREYIGAVTSIAALRTGKGAFETPTAFYDYWRRYPFKTSAQVQRQLQRLLRAAQDELAQLRAQQQAPPQ